MVASKWDESYVKLAESVMMNTGCRDIDLANIIGISEATLYQWKIDHPEFAQAIRRGKDEWDAEHVERALVERAVGYSHPDTHIAVHQGEVIVTPITKHYPPDTAAAKFHLLNRRRHRWRDKQEVEHSGNVVMVTKDEEDL